MAKSGLRFSLQNMLWATLWVALWGATFPIGEWMDRRQMYLANANDVLSILLCWAVFIAAPFAAVGALFGKTELGLFIGAMLALILCACGYWLALTASC